MRLRSSGVFCIAAVVVGGMPYSVSAAPVNGNVHTKLPRVGLPACDRYAGMWECYLRTIQPGARKAIHTSVSRRLTQWKRQVSGRGNTAARKMSTASKCRAAVRSSNAAFAASARTKKCVVAPGRTHVTPRVASARTRPRSSSSRLARVKAINRLLAKKPGLKWCCTYLRLMVCFHRKQRQASKATTLMAVLKTAEMFLKRSRGSDKASLGSLCKSFTRGWADVVRKMPKFKRCLRGVNLPKPAKSSPPTEDFDFSSCAKAPLETKCQAGTKAVGARPPQGYSLWCVDRRKKKHGVWSWWHRNGRLREQISYLKGKRQGVAKKWNAAGVILSEVNYARGKLHGSWTSCFTEKGFEGVGKWSGQYVKGKKHGVWTRTGICPAGYVTGFKQDTPLVTAKVTYRRGRKHGPATYWACSTQKVSYKGNYRNGKKYGAWTSYPTQTEGGGENWSKEITRYKNGVMHGLYELVGFNGSLEKGKYVLGKKAGVWKTWWSNGKKKSSCKYARSQNHGRCEQWYKNGRVRSRASFRHGKKHGKESIWAAYGQRLSVTSYRNGIKHGRQMFWYKNGRKRSQTTFRKGSYHGRRVLWNAAGSVTSDCKYTNGVRSTCRI